MDADAARPLRVLHVGPSEGFLGSVAAESDRPIAVSTVAGGEAALEELRTGTYHCLVCEGPGAEGTALVNELRTAGVALPIVYLTDDHSDVEPAVDADATDVFVRRDDRTDALLLARRLWAVSPGVPVKTVSALATGDTYLLDGDGTVRAAGADSGTGLESGESLAAVVEDGADRLRAALDRLVSAEPGAVETVSVSVRSGSETVPGRLELLSVPAAVEAGDVLATVSERADRSARERQLADARDFNDLLLDTIDDVFYLVGTDGEMARWNDRLNEVTGYTDGEIAAMDAVDFFEGEDRERIASAVGEALGSGSAEVEASIVTRAGDRVPFDFTGARLTDADGNLRGVVGIGRDVTDRRERIEKLEQIRTNIGEVVWMSTPGKSSMDFISDSYEDVWGRSPESLREDPTSFVDAIHPEDRSRVEAALTDQQQNPDAYEETYRIVRPDGEVRWVHDRAAGVYEDGELARTVGVASDITARKEREAELKTKNRAMDEAPIGITIHDATTGAITYVNDGFSGLTGYDTAAVDGERLDVLAGFETGSGPLAELTDAFDRADSTTVVLLLYRADGTPFWGRFSIAPIGDDGVAHYVAFLRDVTESKNHQAEIERRLDEFGDLLAENLQVPVSSARSALRSAEGSDAVEEARASLERVDSLIEDLTAIHSYDVKSRETIDTGSGATDEG